MVLGAPGMYINIITYIEKKGPKGSLDFRDGQVYLVFVGGSKNEAQNKAWGSRRLRCFRNH